MLTFIFHTFNHPQAQFVGILFSGYDLSEVIITNVNSDTKKSQTKGFLRVQLQRLKTEG